MTFFAKKKSTSSTTGASYLSLQTLLEFDWEVALGNTHMKLNEFRELLKDSNGIVKLKDQYVYFDEKEKKIRKMEFKEREIIDGRSIPMVMELVPLNKDGHKTVVRYKSLSFKEKVKDSIFSRKNLQKRK